MNFSRAQSPASQSRKVLTASSRRRSHSAFAVCESTRSGGIYGGARRTVCGAGRRAEWMVGHIADLSMKSNRRARSLGSRILAAGVLPLPQLRCSSRRTKSYHTLTPTGVGPYGVAAKAVVGAFKREWPERKKSAATPSNISPRDERERAVSDSLLWQPRDSRLMHSRGRDLRNFSSLN